MDDNVNYMDDFVSHVDPLKRLHPLVPSLMTVGYMPYKHVETRYRFETINFSFVLSGEGSYGFDDISKVRIKGPAVITQFPGAMMDYGPDPGQTWEELYLIYSAHHMDQFVRSGYYDTDRRHWPITNSLRVRELAGEILDLVQKTDDPGIPDRLDRAADRMIMESLISPRVRLDEREEMVISIRETVVSSLEAHHDFDELARRHGMNPSTFRRMWNRVIGVPPRRFIIGLRIQRARQLLVQTMLPIGIIAEKVGFADPLYFSRQFRQWTGMSARHYRQLNRLPSLERRD